jgi:glycine betaine/proline transport system substrate-binding protein
MKKTEEAIKKYQLDYTLLPSSGTGMAAELARSINSKKSIAVTGWIPHWMFAMETALPEDPQKVYGDAEHVDSVIAPASPPRHRKWWPSSRNSAGSRRKSAR